MSEDASDIQKAPVVSAETEAECVDELMRLGPAATGWRVAFYGPDGVAIKHVACWATIRHVPKSEPPWTEAVGMVEDLGGLVLVHEHQERTNAGGGYLFLEPGIEWSDDMRERDDSCEWIDNDPNHELRVSVGFLLNQAETSAEVRGLTPFVFCPPGRCLMCGAEVRVDELLDAPECPHAGECAYARSLGRVLGAEN